MGSRRGKGGVLYGGLEKARGGPIELLQRGGGGSRLPGSGFGGVNWFWPSKNGGRRGFWSKMAKNWTFLAKIG